VKTLHPTSSGSPACRSSGFSLIEILVAISLLTLIVLGLLVMFNQTQRVFRTGLAQSDILENGRATADLVAHDLEQMTPARLSPYYNNGVPFYFPTNFYAEESYYFGPAFQGLPGTAHGGVPPVENQRVNYIQDFFFLSQVNQDWFGIGYAVLPSATNTGVGTLYRYSIDIPKFCPTNVAYLSSWFRNALQIGSLSVQQNLPVTNMSRVADGVVCLRVKPFAPNGFPIVGRLALDESASINDTNACFRTNAFRYGYANVPQGAVYQDANYPDYVRGCYFWSNAVPASVELELGIIEPQTLRRYQSILNTTLQAQYLSNHTAQVHLFRQRIAIRAADPSAYQ
jgi:type II secretory pathway pseudopilin PulG